MRGSFGVLLGLVLLTAAAPATAAPAGNAMAGFVKSCQTQMYMSQVACSCMAAKAEAELDAKEVAYLSIPGNDGPAAAAATKSMSGAEIARIDKFMRSAPDQCQKAQ